MDKCVQMFDKELWRLGPDGSGDRGKKRKGRKKRTRKSGERERTEGGGEKERGDGKRVGERESEARLEWRKGLSPEIGVKKTMNDGGVENGNMN
ncbi:hypothetical protein TNCV_2890341 [Trichonephila clavipes]|nr:hypothetical protein TNCV_2890341 [Trichonephila clavipes]